MLNTIEKKFIKIENALLIPRSLFRYKEIKFLKKDDDILAVKSEVMNFVNPALFVWVICDQNLNCTNTNPKDLEIVDTLICNLPIKDFINTSKKYKYLLMISNLEVNRNFLSNEDISNELDHLKSVDKNLISFFGQIK